ncbi:MAG TPA: PLP-dependent aminotransferase family protein [Bryobacteraceae bacterium]|nr:PLP-dependent aminotransferase family protein [Bryobacteraceae bacterium]
MSQIDLDPNSDVPLYKQLAESVRTLVDRGAIERGERLPATRELAGLLGLNRTTVSAAYAMLEQSGLLEGHVGRGSFIAKSDRPLALTSLAARSIDWEHLLPPLESLSVPARKISISFASSCPAGEAFPLAEFRRLSKEVIDSPEAAQILQLGSPHGYPPLRRYLLENALAAGMVLPGDDLIVTNGCQQALDLIARLFFNGNGRGVVIEDPVYRGVVRVFARAGATVLSVPLDESGIDLNALQELIHQHRPRLLVVTPSFQNPTGATLPLERRKRLVDLAQRHGLVLVENDICSELRYEGKSLPTLKQLDESGSTILLRSYSKISFPGLRVGWAIAPRPVIARMAEAKQTSDLHSDQLSQAVLLRFAESGELARHLDLTRRVGAERLSSILRCCARYLPAGSRFTRPEGGMSLWVDLPAPFTAETLLSRVEQRGVDFLPGNFFSVQRSHPRALRLSFGGLSPDQISRGMQILGEAAASEPAAALEPVAASV